MPVCVVTIGCSLPRLLAGVDTESYVDKSVKKCTIGRQRFEYATVMSTRYLSPQRALVLVRTVLRAMKYLNFIYVTHRPAVCVLFSC